MATKREIELSDRKPGALPVIEGGIPDELKSLARWVCWSYRRPKKKWTKPPINARTGKPASTTDSATWSTFVEAVAGMKRFGCDGIGIVLCATDDIVGIDMDDCRDLLTGELTPEAAKTLHWLNSYSEISPSKTGVKILARGKLPGTIRRRGKIEAYESERYFTVTGHRVPGTPPTVEARQDEIEQFYRENLEPAGTKNGDKWETKIKATKPDMTIDDAALLRVVVTAKNGVDVFRLYYQGDISRYGGNHSEADLALCNTLAFYAGPNPERIDRLFRDSKLWRDKWDEVHYADGRTYGQGTIAKALEGRTEFYAPPKPSTNGTGGQHGPSAGFGAQGPEPDPIHFTDVGNSRRLIERHGKDILYCHPWKKWLIWCGTHWRVDETGEIIRRAKDTIRAAFKKASKDLEALGKKLAALADRDVDEREKLSGQLNYVKKLLGWLLKSEDAGKLTAMVNLARSDVPILPDDLDADHLLLCCPNGVVDLRIGNRRGHRRDDCITKLCPTPFDPAATCPRLEKFMTEIFPATGDAAEEPGNQPLIDFVHRFARYGISGDVREQVLAAR